jgi:hypothetical protein
MKSQRRLRACTLALTHAYTRAYFFQFTFALPSYSHLIDTKQKMGISTRLPAGKKPSFSRIWSQENKLLL